MKKRFLAMVLAAMFIALFFVHRNTLHLGNPGSAVLTYSYGEIYIWEELYGTDVAAVLDVLNGKMEHTDNPACGFDDEISVTIGGRAFALACDSCGVVKDCATGKYIYISDAERDVLENLFTSRGGKFPCV